MSAVHHDPRRRVLRVGLVREGRIVEERTLKVGESLRVGSSEKNELLIQSSQLGVAYTLLKAGKRGYVLHTPEKAGGRVSDGEHTQHVRGSETLELTEQSRGRLEIGSATILFQFVPEPARAEHAQLPVAARGGFVRGIDWLFTSFVLASYMGFFGLVVYLENADWEIDPPNLLPEITARLVFQEPAPPIEMPEVIQEEVDAPREEVVASTEEVPRVERTANSRTTRNASPSRAENARIREQALERARYLMIGSFSPDGESPIRNLIDDGAPTVNAEEVLNGVSGVDTASRGADHLRERNGSREGSGTRDEIGLIARRETREVMTTSVMERRPRGRTRFERPIDERGEGVLEMSQLSRLVQRRATAIRACYERELNPHPTLAGKVVIEFVVQERGNVTGAHAIENRTGSARLATCLSNVIRGLRVRPGPQGGSVTVRFPFVFALQE